MVLDHGIDPWTGQPVRAKGILSFVPGPGSPEGAGISVARRLGTDRQGDMMAASMALAGGSVES